MEIVAMLNDLYIAFDNVVEEFDVYKVRDHDNTAFFLLGQYMYIYSSCMSVIYYNTII